MSDTFLSLEALQVLLPYFAPAFRPLLLQLFFLMRIRSDVEVFSRCMNGSELHVPQKKPDTLNDLLEALSPALTPDQRSMFSSLINTMDMIHLYQEYSDMNINSADSPTSEATDTITEESSPPLSREELFRTMLSPEQYQMYTTFKELNDFDQT